MQPERKNSSTLASTFNNTKRFVIRWTSTTEAMTGGCTTSRKRRMVTLILPSWRACTRCTPITNGSRRKSMRMAGSSNTSTARIRLGNSRKASPLGTTRGRCCHGFAKWPSWRTMIICEPEKMYYVYKNNAFILAHMHDLSHELWSSNQSFRRKIG